MSIASMTCTPTYITTTNITIATAATINLIRNIDIMARIQRL